MSDSFLVRHVPALAWLPRYDRSWLRPDVIAGVMAMTRTLAVEWRGAPYCSYRATGRTHRSTCVMQGKGGVVFDNPANLSLGHGRDGRHRLEPRAVG